MSDRTNIERNIKQLDEQRGSLVQSGKELSKLTTDIEKSMNKLRWNPPELGDFKRRGEGGEGGRGR